MLLLHINAGVGVEPTSRVHVNPLGAALSPRCEAVETVARGPWDAASSVDAMAYYEGRDGALPIELRDCHRPSRPDSNRHLRLRCERGPRTPGILGHNQVLCRLSYLAMDSATVIYPLIYRLH